MKPTIAIIGGGISGLAAGIYAQLNGFETTIYEKHSIPGGLCSFWERKGFLIDNCIHWLTGTNPESQIYKVWETTHVLGNDVEIIKPDAFLHVQLNGQTLSCWRDINKLKQNMLKVSPQDEKHIEEFINLLEVYKDVILVAEKPMEQLGIIDYFKLLKKMRKVGKQHRKYSLMSIQRYASRFSHPLIRKFLTTYFPRDYNVACLFYVFANFCNGNADLPRGGSKGIIGRMVKRYRELGGNLKLSYEVTKLDIHRLKVEKIYFKNGETASADFLVATCDLHHTMSRLIPAIAVDKYMRDHFAVKRHLYPTYTTFDCYYAVNANQDCLNGTYAIDVDDIVLDGRNLTTCVIKDFNYEPSFAPKGKGIIQAIITQYEDDYDYWKHLRQTDYAEYKSQKQKLAEQVRDKIEGQFKQLKGKLELLDSCSPYTNTRFTNVYKGAIMAFSLTPYNKKIYHRGRVIGVKNMYLAGQWLQAPGGSPNAVVTGKFAIQRICKDWKYQFLND